MIKRRNLMRVFGVATLVLIANIIYKIALGKTIEMYDVLAMGTFVMMFVATITWVLLLLFLVQKLMVFLVRELLERMAS
ncbi:hypothetical protein NQU17_00705 [Clostridiaceae bacterium HFYG-1003]|nr:hypothetical protein NQU17_00705 [Clostridiaceae bacterium HFYG-1003]